MLADGGVTVNGVGVSLPELESQLGQAKAADPKMTVAIKGDAKAHYDKVVAVIDLCNKLEVNMALVTTRIGT